MFTARFVRLNFSGNSTIKVPNNFYRLKLLGSLFTKAHYILSRANSVKKLTLHVQLGIQMFLHENSFVGKCNFLRNTYQR